MWQNYVNALLGLAVFVVAFLNISGASLSWTLGILGAAILVLGLWGAATRSSTDSSDSRYTTRSHA